MHKLVTEITCVAKHFDVDYKSQFADREKIVLLCVRRRRAADKKHLIRYIFSSFFMCVRKPVGPDLIKIR